MGKLVFAMLLGLFAAPAFAAPIPVFDNPKALLEAIYADIKAAENWETYDSDAGFDEVEAFSANLHAAFLKADNAIKATGDEMGVLDVSPFINGQDSGGMDFTVGEPKIKGSRATASVLVTGYQEQTIGFELVDDGAAGWKVDDIILPGYDGDPSWHLSEYFADPRR